MNKIIFDYIEKNVKYIVIFTNLDDKEYGNERKKNLIINQDKTGNSGNWIIAKNKEFDKVILYIREQSQNKIYIADYISKYKADGYKSRYRVYFKNIELVDITNLNWIDFTKSKKGQISPIRYI